MIKKAVIYTRISTNKELQNISQQINYCKDWAAKNGYEIVKVFKDERTGKTNDRKGYRRMLKYLKENPMPLIVQDTDRISRNFYDSVAFEKFIITNKIKLISLSETIDLDTPNGLLMFRIKYALNSQYVENLLEKIKVGVERAKREGKYKGRKKGALGRKNKN